MEIKELQEQIRVVALARLRHQEAVEAKNRAFDEWEKENVGLLDLFKLTAQDKEREEIKLRLMTLVAYSETQDKHPCEGVAIREVIRLDYEMEFARAWALKHKTCLKLDVSAFEKMVKISELRPAFVTVEVIPQATIATNLDLIS